MRDYRVYGDELPLTDKISTAACLGGRTHRPNCCCCGGANGIRRGWRKMAKHSPEYQLWYEGKLHWTQVPKRGHKTKR